MREAIHELEVTKSRVEREAERTKQGMRADLVARIFPVLDSLDRALAGSGEGSSLLDGIHLVREQLMEVLSSYGVKRIESLGKPFDPTEHEAMDVVPVGDSSAHDRVVDEWQPGYRWGQKVLRPAKVRVGKVLA